MRPNPQRFAGNVTVICPPTDRAIIDNAERVLALMQQQGVNEFAQASMNITPLALDRLIVLARRGLAVRH